MPRTDASRVAATLPGNPDEDDLDIHIEDASSIVDDEIPKEDLTDEQLERIERYLAAHSYKFLQNRQLFQFASGSSSGTFSGRFGEGLKGTAWGQMAIESDPTNTLANRFKPDANFNVLKSRDI